MAWAFVADSTATQDGVGSTPATNTYTPSATNNRLIAVSFCTNAAPTACSDTAGNVWHLDAQKGDAGNNFFLSVFSAPITAGAGSSETISISIPTSQRWIMQVREVSGLTTVSGATALDGTATATGTATALSSGNTASASAANEYVFGGIAWDGQPTPVTVGSGFAHFSTTFPASPLKGLGLEDKDSGATGVQSATATQTGTAVNWAIACVVYKLAAAAATAIPPIYGYGSN